MTTYFESILKKPLVRTTEPFCYDDARSDLLQDHLKLVRQSQLTQDKMATIDDMFKKWVNLLFCDFNVAILGPQSKFALLETFRTRYLESNVINDKKGPTKKGKGETNMKLQVVRLHGLDPIKLENFNHTMFGTTTSSKKQAQKDKELFLDKIRKSKQHFVFLIHSFDYFLRDCEEICDTIVELYACLPEQIHVLMSLDVMNTSKKLSHLRFKLKLVFFQAPYTESFHYERSQLMNEFDIGSHGGQVILSDQVDLRSLKDVHQALGNTASILIYILKDYIDKFEAANINADEGMVEDNSDEENNENKSHSRRLRRRTTDVRKSTQPKVKMTTDLDFQHLFSYCGKNFIVRRTATLREHLGELVDHNIISFDGTRIKCLVDIKTCKKFIESIERQNEEET